MEQFKADFLEVLKECFKFDGTLNRTKFWTYSIILSLASFIVNTVLQTVGKITGSNAIIIIVGIISFIIGIAVWVITLGPTIRRLRDGGFSPCLYALILIPCLGGLAVLVLLCLPSKEGMAPAQPATQQPQDQPPAQN